MTRIYLRGIYTLLLLFGFTSCTELDELDLEQSNVTSNLLTPVDPEITIDAAYQDLNGFVGNEANLFALSEVTTDAAIVPTRGSDWNDNGIWRQLHQHNWIVDHSFINTTWEQWNGLHCSMTNVIDPASNATAEQLGQAHFLRAYASFIILDNFGQLVICDPDATTDDDVLSGADAADFILDDLSIAISNLPIAASQSGTLLMRASKSAAQYLTAKMLLNKHVYSNSSPNSSDMTSVVSLVDDIAAQGFNLEEGYFDIFRESADNETIWYLPINVGNRIWNGLHYNQAPELTGGGWNGFATLSEYYDLFEGNPDSNRPNNNQEERRGYVATEGSPFTGEPGTQESFEFPGFTAASSIGYGFLIGQQFEINCSIISDRTGAPLNFERFFTDSEGNSDLENNSEVTGIRVIKYHPQFDSGFTAHEIMFRYSDAHLMKAEALLRNGGDPTQLVNELRLLRGATPLSNVTDQDILDERGRELYMEIWRRNDLIRFGQYTRDWELKDPAAVSNLNLEVFPIPTAAVANNPNLNQNQGY